MRIKTKEDGILDMAFQQYSIGLYVCLYRNGKMVDQFGVDTTKEEFIQDLKDDKSIEILDN